MSTNADARTTVTIVDDGGRPAPLAVTAGDGRLSIPARAAADLLGWRLPADVDLDDLEAALGRPVAVDRDERAVYVGVPAAVQARALTALDAPDFTLPDLEGPP